MWTHQGRQTAAHETHKEIKWRENTENGLTREEKVLSNSPSSRPGSRDFVADPIASL